MNPAHSLYPCSPPYGDAVTGELNGDYFPDVVMVCGSQVIAFFDPGITEAYDTVGAFTNPQLLSLKSANPYDSNRDAVVISSESADPVVTFVIPLMERLGTRSFGDASWHGAQQLRTGALGGLYALSSDGLTLLFVDDPLAAEAPTTIALPAACTDFIPLQWSLTNSIPDPLEFVVTGPSATYVLHSDGSVNLTFPGAVCTSLAVVTDGFQERAVGSILWMDSERLFSLAQSSMDPLQVLGMGAFGASVGDENADGLADVVFGNTASSYLPILYNQGGGDAPHFSWSASDYRDPTGSNTDPMDSVLLDRAIPAFTDLDLDGDDDFFTGVTAEQRAVRVLSAARFHLDWAPRATAGHYTTFSDENDQLTLELAGPNYPLDDSLVLLVSTWRQDDLFTHRRNELMDEQVHPLPTWPFTIDITLDPDAAEDAFFHVVLQVAPWDASTSTAGTPGPPAIWSCCTDEDLAAELEAIYGSLGSSILLDHDHDDEGDDDQLPPVTSHGSGVPLPDLPPAPPGDIPPPKR